MSFTFEIIVTFLLEQYKNKMIEKAFKYNTNAHYATGGVYKNRNLQIVTQEIQVASDIKTFKASFPNILEYIFCH